MMSTVVQCGCKCHCITFLANIAVRIILLVFPLKIHVYLLIKLAINVIIPIRPTKALHAP